jgi:hypothetical protein
MEPSTSSGAGPASAADGLVDPTSAAWKTEPGARSPTVRSSQPVRSVVPGAARSSSAMAVKCERDGSSWPTACTAARLPAVQSGSSGASAGCRPKMPVSGSRAPVGSPIVGRSRG